jgi:hypothetical protein
MIHVRFGRTDSNVEVQTDVCRRSEPGRGIVSRQTDGVVACVVRGEGEASVGWTTCIGDSVAIFHFLRKIHSTKLRGSRSITHCDLHEDSQLFVYFVLLLLLIPFYCAVVT